VNTWRLIVLILALLAEWAPAAEGRKKNVLFISVDDLNCRIGCYGDPIAKTPNMDALAKRGVMFSRAYCQYPLCNPSRVSLLTGMRPDVTRVYDLETNFRLTVPDAVALPELFRKNGYYSARVGKIFHYGVPRQIGTSGMDDPQSWDSVFNPIGRDKTEEKKIHLLTKGGYTNTIGFSMAWLDMDGPDEDQTDAKGVTETIRLLEEKKDGPFFIAMGFYRPHTPFIAPKKYFDLYPPESIQLPKRDPEAEKKLPDVVRQIRPDDYGLNEKDLRDCVRAYYASVSFVDAQLGRLIEAMDRLKLSDNTLIVFWSDHGFLLGEHGQWQKQLLFDPSPRVPLIVVEPGAKGNGTACGKTVELLDVYKTCAEWAGLRVGDRVQGQSLRPLLTDHIVEWDKPAFSQVTRMVKKTRVMGRSVHMGEVRYTEWDEGRLGVELYDHKKDPEELVNLAGREESNELQERMKWLLKEWKEPGR
jgi:uncharacterized sulfatase